MDERTQDLHASDADQGPEPAPETGVAREKGEVDGERAAIAREQEQARQLAMFRASESLQNGIGNLIAISALLTWSPNKAAEADQLVAVATRNLADFRAHLSSAAALGAKAAETAPGDPGDEFPDLYVQAVTRLREVHRQWGALIALFDADAFNTPALVAMSRSIGEAEALAAVSLRGTSLCIDAMGMAR